MRWYNVTVEEVHYARENGELLYHEHGSYFVWIPWRTALDIGYLHPLQERS